MGWTFSGNRGILREIMQRSHWFIRYRLYHLPFWMLYNLCWWSVESANPVGAFRDAFASPYAIKFLGYVIFQTLGAYVNLYFLVPRLLQKGRWLAYFGALALTIVCAGSLIVLGYYLTPILSGRTYADLFGPKPFNFFLILISNPLPSTTAAMTLALSVKLAQNWLTSQRRQQALEKEKLETELNFLKYQFNPHFLFNTINSIFFLIHKDPHRASDSLAKFSELLRYQLYECNDEQISLPGEVAYLENFIGLEKLRKNAGVEVQLDLPAVLPSFKVAPFILMTFVENAFKHVSADRNEPRWIRISLVVEDRSMDFSVSNSTGEEGTEDVVHYGGIGLKNVQRRLDLLYPGRHQLDVEAQQGYFLVRLRLQLREPEFSMTYT